MSIAHPSSRQDYRFAAAVTAYELARSLPVVVLTSQHGNEWLVQFDDEDHTAVVVGANQDALLGIGVPTGELLTHYRAGHRTTRDGLGVGDTCTACEPGSIPKGFTHPAYRAPVAATAEPVTA